jgi:hypothetical protein
MESKDKMSINFFNHREQFKMKLFPSSWKKKSVKPEKVEVPLQPLVKQEQVVQISKDFLKVDAKSDKKITNVTIISEEEKSEGIISRVHRFVRDFFYKKCKGKTPSRPEEIHQAMRTIGGEPLNLTTSAGAELRGMHFKADSLVKKLQESGMQRVTITKKKSEEEISAMVLDPSNPKTAELMNALEQMGLFELTYLDKKTGAKTILVEGVWEKKVIDGKIYIFTKDNAKKLRSGCRPFKRNSFNSKDVAVSKPFNSTFERTDRKTIVLNGGLYSHYESIRTSSEVAKLVALGFDVVVSEDKHPRIQDTESHTKVMASRDAIYEELDRLGVKNDDIIWKGTCFSSVPAVEAAAKYEGTHVWIDQGYFESSELVANQVPLASGFMAPMVRPIVDKIARSVDFDYNMEPHLPNIKGKIMIIRNVNDSVISSDQHAKIKNALNGRSDVAEFSITNKAVKHAGAWFNDTECHDQIVDYLISSEMSGGDILA